DKLVQQRLCKLRFICLVVSETTVTQQVNEYVSFVFLTIFYCHIDGVHYRFSIVTIHVEYWRRRDFRYVSTICSRTCIFIVCRETYLVVDYNMDSTTCFVAIQLRHLCHFVYHPLTCNSRVPVNKDRCYLRRVSVVFHVDLRTYHTFHHRIYSL